MPKATGGSRKLYCPNRTLKAVQAWILKCTLDGVLHEDKAAAAYVLGKGLLQNAIPHKGKRFILCLDLVNFFDNIRESAVIQVFENAGYSGKTAFLLTRLCCCDGHLPQGAVTSPKLSNLVCRDLDEELRRRANERQINYTRYADDLTLSCNSYGTLLDFERQAVQILRSHGFTVNIRKRKLMGDVARKAVTGLVITGDQISIGRKRKRYIRMLIWRLEKKAVKDFSEAMKQHVDQLSGTSPVREKLTDLYKRQVSPEYIKPDCETMFQQWRDVLPSPNASNGDRHLGELAETCREHYARRVTAFRRTVQGWLAFTKSVDPVGYKQLIAYRDKIRRRC